MKNKILAFVMCIIFAVSVFSVAFADTTDTENNQTETAYIEGNNVSFAKAVGLMDQEALGSDNFTRAELAKLVTKIILYNTGSVEESEYQSAFTDVEPEDVPYVMTAVNYGILNGVGNALFMPDENVTYAQLVKAMVAILGRDEEAKARGGYPTGYMAVAIQEGINRYAPADINSFVNKNGVANILRQMVNSNVMYIDNNGDMVDYNRSYLWHYCSIKHISDIAESVRGVSIYSQLCDYDVVTVDGQTFKITDDSSVSPDMLGKRVDVFYKDVNGINTVVYIEESLDGNLVLDSKDIVDVSEDGYIRYDGKRDRLLSVDPSGIVIYNNAVLGNYTIEDLNPFKNTSKDGNVVLVDGDGDRAYDLVKITAYDSYVVSDVQNSVVFSKSRKFSLDLNTLEKNAVVNILSEPIPPESIEEGDIINVMTDKSGNVTQIIVTIDTFSGVIDSISYSGADPEFVEVAGKEFECSGALRESANLSDLKIGTALKLYFNPRGRICEIDANGLNASQIGYLIDAKQTGTMDTGYIAKILTSGGEIKVFNLAKKVSVTVGQTDNGVKTAADAIGYAGKTLDRVKRQPILYSFNSSDEISKITYPDFDASKSEDGFYQYPDFDGETDLSSYYYRGSPRSFSAKVLIGNNTTVLRVAEESCRDNDKLYCQSEPADFLTGNVKLKLEAYGFNGSNPMADIMIVRVNENNAYEINAQGQIYVVKSISNGLNPDGEEITKLTLVGLNAETTLTADPIATRGVEVGDVIRYAQNETAIVKNIEKIFSKADMSLVNMTNPSQSSVTAGTRFSFGTVVYADENAFTVRIGTGADAIYESYPIAGFKKAVVDTSGRKVEVSVGTNEMLLGENDYGALASKVLIHTSSLDCASLVIYK